MSDATPEEQPLTKRERQKQRRHQKRAAEQQARARERRRRLGAFAVIVVLLLGVSGFALTRYLQDRAAEQELIAAAEERMDELGCTEITEMPEIGRTHFAPEQLPENPPDAIYPDRPATSGQHMGQVTVTGVYDEYIDERLILHNLEHGYVVYWYDPDAPDDQVEQLKQWGQQRIDGGDEHLIVAQYNEPLPDDANFASVAWNYRQLCETFDEGIALAFLNEHHDSPDAPEPRAGPHFGGAPGELDPADEEGELVFPPLGEVDLEEPPASEEATPGEEGEAPMEEVPMEDDAAP